MASESSDKVFLRSPAEWPRWFASICDQAKYEYVWEYIDPNAMGTVTDSSITRTVQTLPLELFITEDVSDIVFKMQLEKYKRWEKKIKAIKSLDNYVI